MPTTLSGVLLFVVLLLPGFAYIVGRERHTTGQQLSPFRETAVVVAASVSFELTILVIFAVVRAVLPSSLTPDVGALVRDSGRYLRGHGAQSGHYGQVAIWATAMLALSIVFAYCTTIPEVRSKIRHFVAKGQKLPRVGRLINDAMGEYPHQSSVSAWWMLFDTWKEDADVRVRCFLGDGSYVEGDLGMFSREADDKPERDLVLVQPISYRPSGSTEIHSYEEASAVCISAARIVTMFVTYSLDTQVTYPAASVAEAVAPDQASAVAEQPSPSGPS